MATTNMDGITREMDKLLILQRRRYEALAATDDEVLKDWIKELAGDKTELSNKLDEAMRTLGDSSFNQVQI